MEVRNAYCTYSNSIEYRNTHTRLFAININTRREKQGSRQALGQVQSLWTSPLLFWLFFAVCVVVGLKRDRKGSKRVSLSFTEVM